MPWRRLVPVVPVVAFVGLLGATAFNPDGGWLLHSFALYEAFGAPGEIAALLTPLLVVALVGYELVRGRRSRR